MSDFPPVEETHTPAVSSLRSKFEQLAVDTSKSAHRLSSASTQDIALLAPPDSGSPRPRASSTSNEQKPSPKLLRAASSSSDLKVYERRPPPTPPQRNSQVNTPAGSPLLRPTALQGPESSPISSPSLLSLDAKKALLARKPPPPPPNTPRIEPPEPVGGPSVSALRSKFR